MAMTIGKESIYRKAGIKCLGNALNLSESSEILNESGKVGVSISLMVLASEELSKAEVYSLMAEGLLSVDENDLGKTYVYDRRFLWDHATKEIQFIVNSIISPFVDLLNDTGATVEEISEFLGEMENGNLGKKRRSGSTLAVTKADYEDFEKSLKEQSERSMAFFGNMNDLKLKGLYVDITDEGIVSPKKLDKSIYEKLGGMFEQNISRYSDLITNGFPEFMKEELKKAIKRIVGTQTKPMFRGLKMPRTNLGRNENYEKITKGQAIQMSKLCTENSRSLFEAAQTLVEKGKGYNGRGLFGTATALLALAHEELVKAIIFGMVFSGYAVISSRPVKGKHVIHPSQIKCHSCKNELAAWNDVTSFVKSVRLPNGASFEREVEEIQAIINSPIPKGKDGPFIGMGVPPDKVGIARKHFELVSNLWGLKESCLYVFVSEDDVQSPANFPPILYNLVKDIVGRLVLGHHPFEEYDNLNFDNIPEFLFPKEDEVVIPKPCPHRNTKREMGRILIGMKISESR